MYLLVRNNGTAVFIYIFIYLVRYNFFKNLINYSFLVVIIVQFQMKRFFEFSDLRQFQFFGIKHNIHDNVKNKIKFTALKLFTNWTEI